MDVRQRCFKGARAGRGFFPAVAHPQPLAAGLPEFCRHAAAWGYIMGVSLSRVLTGPVPIDVTDLWQPS